MQTTTRAADLQTIATMLEQQRSQRHDIVIPASALHATHDGRVWADGDEVTTMDAEGVNTVVPQYDVTDVAEEGVSDKLGIPRAYLRKMRETFPQLWATNINEWARHESHLGRKLLVRGLVDPTTGEAVARAILSNKHKAIENLDVLMAALEGVQEAGVEVKVTRADLTERRMIVTLHSPQVQVEAERLLAGYRGPWHVEGLAQERDEVTRRVVTDLAGERERLGAHHMYEAGQEPIIFGGMQLGNSDVGCGAFALSSQLLIARCTNGLTIPAGKVRKVHLGAAQTEGQVDWSTRTLEAELELVKRQTVDAIRAFLSADWVREQVSALEERAGVAVTKVEETITHVTKALTYGEERRATILSHFIAGGQLTAGGVMQAVTSAAQTVADGDEAAQMEADGVRALDLAASFASR